MTDYLAAFGLTLAVELPLYYLGLTRLLGVRPGAALIAGSLCNVVTHPLIWFALLPWLYGWIPATAAMAIAEVWVMLAEWTILTRITHIAPSKALLLCLLANSTSFIVGRYTIG